jgi:hypothetical protein
VTDVVPDVAVAVTDTAPEVALTLPLNAGIDTCVLGALHVRPTCPFPAVVASDSGIEFWPVANTTADGIDEVCATAPLPAAVIATTWKLYAVPAVRPDAVYVVERPTLSGVVYTVQVLDGEHHDTA